MINIDDCLIGELPSDYFKKLEKWSEENRMALDANLTLLQKGEITFSDWFKRDYEIKSTAPKAIFPEPLITK